MKLERWNVQVYAFPELSIADDRSSGWDFPDMSYHTVCIESTEKVHTAGNDLSLLKRPWYEIAMQSLMLTDILSARKHVSPHSSMHAQDVGAWVNALPVAAGHPDKVIHSCFINAQETGS